MKRSIIIITLAVLINSCASHENTGGYIVNGTIQGVRSGTVKLMRTNNSDRTSKAIDSFDFSDGKFTLKGKLESPEMMTLVIEPGNWSFEIFIEHSNISVTADTAGASYYDWTAYGSGKGAHLAKYTIAGSQSQDTWMQFQHDPRLKAFEPQFAILNKAYEDARGKADETEKIRSQSDSLRSLYTTVQKKWIDSFVAADPSAAAGAYLLHYYYKYNNDMPLRDMETLVAKYTGPAKSTVYFDIVSDVVKKRQALLPGNTAPDFTLKKPDSSSFTLSSLRGKFVLLDFWASWCVPCRQAIPHWKEVYSKYQSKDFEVLSITNDSRWSDWFKALQEEKMPWLQVADEFPIKNMPARVGELYMTPYLPTYILLDKEGKIILYNASEQQIDEKLKEVFKA